METEAILKGVDGHPIGKHYCIRIYDDLVTREIVTTPEIVSKVTTAWEKSIKVIRRNRGM